MAQQRTVDVHNHLYPKEYLDFLAGRKGKQHRAEQTGPNSYLLWDEDVIIAHIDRAGHYDPEARVRDLDNAGLDTQVISKTIPDPSCLPKDEGIYWAKKTNDHYAEVSKKYPHRIYAMACLPYQDPDAACKELERCIKDLNVKGIQMFSNCNGDVMWDKKFDGIFKIASDNNLPFLMHPTTPLTKDAMKKSRIPYQLYGYTVDTSLATVALIFNGVFQKHKGVKIVHAHLGGVVPYLVRRMKDSWKGYSKEWGLALDDNPADTYKTRVYPDTTSFYLPAMKCCLEWVGPGQMVIGTDYAHRVGDPEGAIRAVLDLQKQANLSTDDVNKILGQTAEKLFNLPAMPEGKGAPKRATASA